jgi:hypothetical protein
MGLIILFSVVARTDESFVYGTDQSALMLITQLVLFQYHLQLLSFSHYNVPGLNL